MRHLVITVGGALIVALLTIGGAHAQPPGPADNPSVEMLDFNEVLDGAWNVSCLGGAAVGSMLFPLSWSSPFFSSVVLLQGCTLGQLSSMFFFGPIALIAYDAYSGDNSFLRWVDYAQEEAMKMNRQAERHAARLEDSQRRRGDSSSWW